MKVIYFSSDISMIEEWKKKHTECPVAQECYDESMLRKELEHSSEETIVIADYDSIAQEINKFITNNTLPSNTIVLEKTPEITSGKMLIRHDIKAYGNSRMRSIHFMQMLNSVLNKKVWTYPQLTAALAKKDNELNEDACELLKNRLTQTEIKIVHAILEGLTNNAIAQKYEITLRTVKAHVSSIFTKLHINDRVSLVLLLK